MRLSLFAAVALLSTNLAAYADTFLTYRVNAAYTNGGIVTGTLILDSTNGVITAVNLTASGFPLGSGAGYTRIFQLGTGINVKNGQLGTEVEFFSPMRINAGYDATSIPVTSSTFISGRSSSAYQSVSATITEETSASPSAPTSAARSHPALPYSARACFGVAGVLKRRLHRVVT